jgi:hypothetical protein
MTGPNNHYIIASRHVLTARLLSPPNNAVSEAVEPAELVIHARAEVRRVQHPVERAD